MCVWYTRLKAIHVICGCHDKWLLRAHESWFVSDVCVRLCYRESALCLYLKSVPGWDQRIPHCPYWLLKSASVNCNGWIHTKHSHPLVYTQYTYAHAVDRHWDYNYDLRPHFFMLFLLLLRCFGSTFPRDTCCCDTFEFSMEESLQVELFSMSVQPCGGFCCSLLLFYAESR